MPRFETKSLSTEALLTLFSGLSLLGCQKSSPEVSAEVTQAAASAATVSSAKAPAVLASAKEVAPPAGSAKADGEGGCAPGGCAPGKCAGNKK